ncbi:carboxypeptidase-like regulatory domain-containing protein [Limisphaera ngatamarikiensis]|uniref:Carboxypeptidase-like regulatory domain-containing protein n=1 Tax=Limisphaera ngatamarikiensis TaxID=1324935 RepID=A0A6M1RXY5_9BACT|nr:carboxypeptidase-like regulatory domain-containing protein [Limisphaera ngatamarikiensis]NGO39602.1 carboxypeptidase-like regulatory domain-containing protein [Limisphaera ngatamarikiensis]
MATMKSIALAILLAAAFVGLWFYAGMWTKKYWTYNCAFRVSGMVVDAFSKRPLSDVEVHVQCHEAITSDHKLRGKPLYSTNYVVNTDADGGFSVFCFGAYISLTFNYEGYDEEGPWRFSNRESRPLIVTNLLIELKPKRRLPSQTGLGESIGAEAAPN